ncbi:MAG: Eco57I restriction-modification methylase domain-containing protein, partial [Promethearchaeota archaeon]
MSMNASLKEKKHCFFNVLSMIVEKDGMERLTVLLNSFQESETRTVHEILSRFTNGDRGGGAGGAGGAGGGGIGVVYTPIDEVDFMCHLALSRYLGKDVLQKNQIDRKDVEKLKRARIMDPSCGAGIFLARMMHFVFSLIDEEDKAPEVLVCLAKSMLFGFDVDGKAVLGTKLAIAWEIISHLPGTGDGTVERVIRELLMGEKNIIQDDFLLFSGGGLEIPEKFDLIIGNPPYIRQEDIFPPFSREMSRNLETRRAYKESLVKILGETLPGFLSFNKMSDYYVYFFFKSFSLLEEGGVLELITSNSWLFTKFGRELQEYLLVHLNLIAIIDFSSRIFRDVEINTVITLCENPPRNVGVDGNVMHFFSVKAHLDHDGIHALLETVKNPPALMDSASFLSVVKTIVDSQLFRAVPIKQAALLKWNKKNPSGRYRGDNWKGKYLNADDVLYEILGSGEGKLTQLQSIARVRSGCYSGINDFFYVRARVLEKFKVEPRYLKPLIRNQADVDTLLIEGIDRYFVLAIPPISKNEIKSRDSPGLLEYIEWGEGQVTRKGQKTRAGIP